MLKRKYEIDILVQTICVVFSKPWPNKGTELVDIKVVISPANFNETRNCSIAIIIQSFKSREGS